jgi:hypothetical protein
VEIMENKYLNTIVKTEKGSMTRKAYLDLAIKSKAIFWKAEREGIKTILYFAGLGSNTMKINKTMYEYAMSKIDYKFNFCTGYGE